MKDGVTFASPLLPYGKDRVQVTARPVVMTGHNETVALRNGYRQIHDEMKFGNDENVTTATNDGLTMRKKR